MKTDIAPAPRMDADQIARYRRAAHRATQLWPAPNPLGELASREIGTWAEFGWRLAPGGLIHRLVAFVEAEQHRLDRERAAAEKARVAEVARLAFRGAWGCSASEVHR